jgi:SAM-dependent methyltransferase
MLQKRDAQMLPCPACGRGTVQRYLYSKNRCDILQCQDCGIGRTETAGFDPAAYYTKGYFSGQHADGYADYVGAEHVLRREFARVADFVHKQRPGGKLLDVGCAYGFFLQEAKRHYEVAGIELAEDAVAHARRSGLTVLHGVADEATLDQLGMMDVIVLLDVIEHLPDPRETLALCARHLNPGGIVVITTGDFASPSARLAGAQWRLMTPPQHLWFFTRAAMQNLADSMGLRLESFDHPWKLVPLSLILFQLRRMLGGRPTGQAQGSGFGLPVNLFDAMRVVMRKPAA